MRAVLYKTCNYHGWQPISPSQSLALCRTICFLVAKTEGLIIFIVFLILGLDHIWSKRNRKWGIAWCCLLSLISSCKTFFFSSFFGDSRSHAKHYTRLKSHIFIFIFIFCFLVRCNGKESLSNHDTLKTLYMFGTFPTLKSSSFRACSSGNNCHLYRSLKASGLAIMWFNLEVIATYLVC